MESLNAWIPQIAVAALGVGIVAIAAWIGLAVRVRRFARPFDALAEKVREGDAAAALQAQLQGVERNHQRIEETLAYVRHLRTQAMNAIQAIGFLRYDAFEDIRGQQSFSLCMLDAHQNGLLFTSIAGRTDSRGYAKPIRSGTCELAMSEEEQEVLELAIHNLHEAEEPVVAGV